MAAEHKEKVKILKAGLCGESILFILPSLIVTGLLIWKGIENFRLFPPGTDTTGRIGFVFGPFLLAGFILLIMFFTLWSNLQIKITITPNTITYERGKKNFTLLWRDLVYRPPNYKQKMFRYFIISDGRQVG
ncbi:MAG: hypothetical protein ACLFQV_12990, partial [Vulcanimicrobiota bacterium]